MKIIDPREMARRAYERYVRHYELKVDYEDLSRRMRWKTSQREHEDRQDRARRIKDLGLNPSPFDVKKILAEGKCYDEIRFLNVPRCGNCWGQFIEVLELMRHKSETQCERYYLCRKCLIQALMTMDS